MSDNSRTPSSYTTLYAPSGHGIGTMDHKVDNNGQCACENPNRQWYSRFEGDYVRLGNHTLVSLKRWDAAS